MFGLNGHKVDFSNYCVLLCCAESSVYYTTICRVNGAVAAAAVVEHISFFYSKRKIGATLCGKF